MKIKFLLLIFISFAIGGIIYLRHSELDNDSPIRDITVKVFPTITPTPYKFPYNIPQIAKNQSYRTIIVGDSLVRALGPNAEILRQNLKKYYKDSEFVNYNYGYSSTNIETVPDRLTKATTTGVKNEEEHPAILDQDFELIILESFGYNPLSEKTLEDGLKKQEKVLDEILYLILSRRSNSILIFMTPIAPDPLTFAKGTLDLSLEQRKSWVEERVAYIKNFQKYAEERGIPVIDIYSKSLLANGKVNRSYISDDYIHPSPKGLNLMSREIADYIFQNKIFPE